MKVFVPYGTYAKVVTDSEISVMGYGRTYNNKRKSLGKKFAIRNFYLGLDISGGSRVILTHIFKN